MKKLLDYSLVLQATTGESSMQSNISNTLESNSLWNSVLDKLRMQHDHRIATKVKYNVYSHNWPTNIRLDYKEINTMHSKLVSLDKGYYLHDPSVRGKGYYICSKLPSVNPIKPTQTLLTDVGEFF